MRKLFTVITKAEYSRRKVYAQYACLEFLGFPPSVCSIKLIDPQHCCDNYVEFTIGVCKTRYVYDGISFCIYNDNECICLN